MMMMAFSFLVLLPLQASAFASSFHLTQRPGLEQPAQFLTQIPVGRYRDNILEFPVLPAASSGSEATGSEIDTISSSDVSSRRTFLISTSAGALISIGTNPYAAVAEESAEADPFAQLDSFASSMIGSPPSSTTSSSPPNNDLSNALQQAKKKRQIDPRTHG